MSQTYDVTMTEDQRATLLIVLDSTDTQGGIKGARRQARAATALESFKLRNPVSVSAEPGSSIRIPPKSPVVVRLTLDNVEVIVESVERACKPTFVQGQEVKPSVLTVRGMKIVDSIIETLEMIMKGEASELEDVEVVGLNGTGKGTDVPSAGTE